MLVPSWSVVEQFEQAMADYCDAPYAVAVDTCTSALFLCIQRFLPYYVTIPSRTYLGVACVAKHSGAVIKFVENDWIGDYPLVVWDDGTRIVDSACRLRRGMYKQLDGRERAPRSLTCLSFQSRKHLKIGRGGMILTDDKSHADWFRKARFCGRSETNSEPEFVGWHCYMEPERAARGLVLLDSLPDQNPDLKFDYPDLREYRVFQ